MRSFLEWKNSLPKDIQEKYFENDCSQLNHVNYIWVTNLMNDSSNELNPTVDELVEWIKTGQISAKWSNFNTILIG